MIADHSEAEGVQSQGGAEGLQAEVETWVWKPEIQPGDPPHRVELVE